MKLKTTAIKPAELIPSEHIEQVSFVNWCRSEYPACILFAVPNGEKRNISVAKRLKNEGVLPGVPDLVFINLGIIIFIEMKRVKRSTTSQEQKDMHRDLREHGQVVILAKGAKDAANQLQQELVKANAWRA